MAGGHVEKGRFSLDGVILNTLRDIAFNDHMIDLCIIHELRGISDGAGALPIEADGTGESQNGIIVGVDFHSLYRIQHDQTAGGFVREAFQFVGDV